MESITASLKAFRAQVQSGKAGNDRLKVYYSIKESENGATIQTLKKNLGLQHQTLTARVSQLEDLGVIFRVKTENSDYTIYKVETDHDKQLNNINSRKQQKFKTWLKKVDQFSGNFSRTALHEFEYLQQNLEK